MTYSPKEVGDAWGRIAGLVLDVCKSHHAAGPIAAKPSDDNARVDPNAEIPSITVSAACRCDKSWTKKAGEARLKYEGGPPGMQYTPPQMRFLLAGDGLGAATFDAPAVPPVYQGPGPERVDIDLDPQLPRGLYIGQLGSVTANNAVPQVPVLIYIDDVVI